MHHCSTYFIKNKGVFAPPMLSDSDFKLCYTIPYTLIINISRGQVPMIYTKVTIFFFKSKHVGLPKMAFKVCPVDRHHDHIYNKLNIEGHQAKKISGEESSTIPNHIRCSENTFTVVNIVFCTKSQIL